MIHEMRQYTLKPGTTGDYLGMNEALGRSIRADRYGKLLGYWTTQTGTLHRLVHIWEYEDLNDRARLRAEMKQIPAWGENYIAKVQVNMLRQKVDFLLPLVPISAPSGGPHFYELRWYRAHPGGANRLIELLEGVAPLFGRFVNQVGFWRTEPSMLSEVVQLCAHRSLDERFERMAELEREPQWQAFRQAALPLLSHETSTLMSPAAFSPLK